MSRTTYDGTGTGSDGDDVLANISGHIDTFYDQSVLTLGSVAGTAQAVTASVTPAFDAGGLVAGMKFVIRWASAAAGATTLNIDSEGAVAVTDAEESAITADAFAANSWSLLHYDGTAFRIVGGAGALAGQTVNPDRQQFTASGTWTKPSGYHADANVMVRAWAAGGGGDSITSGAGGGGGEYAEYRFRYGDMASSVAVTVGTGGATDTDGGASSFGALLTVAGGKQGGGSTGGLGGGLGGGAGGGSATDGSDASTIWAGGGGGGSDGGGTDGGDAVMGGGGGGGNSTGGNGGNSKFGGDGGDSGAPGVAPGGGGGRGAAGARGEVIVEVFQ